MNRTNLRPDPVWKQCSRNVDVSRTCKPVGLGRNVGIGCDPAPVPVAAPAALGVDMADADTGLAPDTDATELALAGRGLVTLRLSVLVDTWPGVVDAVADGRIGVDGICLLSPVAAWAGQSCCVITCTLYISTFKDVSEYKNILAKVHRAGRDV